jgi:tripartite ATP-independent transporter DctM subunit
MITGVVQGGSSLGILIPPSVVLVLYGMIARQPVGQLWLAGVLPGLLMATVFVLYIMVRCRLNPALAPTVKDEDLNMPMIEKLRLLRAGIVPFLIFFFMTGLFVFGYTSLVESSAVGATAATIAAAVKGRLNWPMLMETSRKTLAISAMFMWLILAALAFGAVFDGLGAARALENLFLDQWHLEPWMVLTMMMATFIILGIFLDDTAMLVIVAPLYIPLVRELGYDLVWFGVLYTITCQIAYITPPFGYNLFLMRAMAPKEITLVDIYRSIWPFVIMMVGCILLVAIFPGLALWLPNYVYGK